MSIRSRRVRGAGWIAIGSTITILLATLSPWLGIAPMRIPTAWCLACGGAWVMDAVSNLLLFAPLGGALAARAWRMYRVALVAAALSLLVETMQSFGIPPSRSPSLSDLVTNTTGAMLGALLVRFWTPLRLPDPPRALRLAQVAALLTVTVVVLTAIALTPRYPTVDGAGDLRRSRFDYAPGYGWYGGSLTDLRLNDRSVAHTGEGPLVMEGARLPRSVTMTTTLRGRDSAWYTRAMIFVHHSADTLPEMSLSQRGHHLEVHIERRGTSWGLYMPYIRRANALRRQTVADTTPLHIRAAVHRDRLQLQLAQGDTVTTTTLALTPTIGWAMLQSVIGPSHPIAPIIAAAWMLTLAVPLGWWCGLTRRPRRAVGLAALTIIAAVDLSAQWAGIHRPPLIDWLTLGSGLAGAAWLSRRSRPRRADGYIQA